MKLLLMLIIKKRERVDKKDKPTWPSLSFGDCIVRLQKNKNNIKKTK
jgi:hypothetical protein